MAFNQGKTAALNMLGRDVPHDVVPYFYSVLADWGELEYVGPASDWDEEIVRGSVEARQLHQLVPGRRPGGGGPHGGTLGRPRPRAPAARRRRAARTTRATADPDCDLDRADGDLARTLVRVASALFNRSVVKGSR